MHRQFSKKIMYGETGNIQSINAFFQDAAFQKNRGKEKLI